jgi:hypothetical protein
LKDRTTGIFGEHFKRIQQRLGSEARGQTWGDVQLRGETIHVDGITDSTDKDALASYLEELLEDTANSVAVAETEGAAAQERTEQRQAEAEETAAKLTERFRE